MGGLDGFRTQNATKKEWRTPGHQCKLQQDGNEVDPRSVKTFGSHSRRLPRERLPPSPSIGATLERRTGEQNLSRNFRPKQPRRVYGLLRYARECTMGITLG